MESLAVDHLCPNVKSTIWALIITVDIHDIFKSGPLVSSVIRNDFQVPLWKYSIWSGAHKLYFHGDTLIWFLLHCHLCCRPFCVTLGFLSPCWPRWWNCKHFYLILCNNMKVSAVSVHHCLLSCQVAVWTVSWGHWAVWESCGKSGAVDQSVPQVHHPWVA